MAGERARHPLRLSLHGCEWVRMNAGEARAAVKPGGGHNPTLHCRTSGCLRSCLRAGPGSRRRLPAAAAGQSRPHPPEDRGASPQACPEWEAPQRLAAGLSWKPAEAVPSVPAVTVDDRSSAQRPFGDRYRAWIAVQPNRQRACGANRAVRPSACSWAFARCVAARRTHTYAGKDHERAPGAARMKRLWARPEIRSNRPRFMGVEIRNGASGLSDGRRLHRSRCDRQ
jgi:hypothetical protein